jgi:transposase
MPVSPSKCTICLHRSLLKRFSGPLLVRNAIFYHNRNACAWRGLPGDFPPYGIALSSFCLEGEIKPVTEGDTARAIHAD